MNNRSCSYLLLLACFCFFQEAYTQDSTATFEKIITLPDKLFASIEKKTTTTENKLDQQTKKYLSKLQKQEHRLKKQLLNKDSVLAHELFRGINDQYRSLEAIPQNPDKYSFVYSGHLDSLTTALNFLKNNKTASIASNEEVEKTLQHLSQLQGKLNQTDRINKYLQERRKSLNENLKRLGMVKELKKYQKQVYDYQNVVRESKQAFEDPGKLEAKLLEVAMKIPQFKDFFARNSLLGSLFALPGSGSGGTAHASLRGLQTRDVLTAQIAERFGSGTDVTQMLQQNVQAAQSSLSALKDKVSGYSSGSFGNGSEDMQMSDYQSKNHQGAKSFFKRLEWGGNVQSQKSRGLLPANADIAATVGYRLNDHHVAGLGFSYRVGLGHGIQNIRITHQGVGIRSYVDMKLKGSIYLSGGYELNQWAQIRSLEQLKDHSGWSKAGLVGLTKKYSISKKFKGTAQLLWDFLSYQQVPKTQTILWRLGYNFKR